MVKAGLIAFAAALFAIPSLAHAQVHDSSFTEANGDRVLQQSIDIHGKAACVWKRLTDEATLKASGIPLVHVELRNGGVIEEGLFDAAKLGDEGNIRHQIIAYLPERLLVLRNQQVPPIVTGSKLYANIVQIVAVDPRDDGSVRLTISHTGYGGADYDPLYSFFHDHNPTFLLAAKKACESPK